MAIQISSVTGNRASLGDDVQSFSCRVVGDGESTSLTINVSKTPFDFKFNVVPSLVDLVLDGVEGLPDVTGVISTDETGDIIITCTLSAPLESTPGHLEDVAATYMSGTFIYNE